MKANQKFKNDRAEVGVGTLIVFIAMVLVAAVAAAVLINTTGSLQQRAQATGKEATQEVSSNLKVVNVYGLVASDKINEIRMNVQLAAGAADIDLEELIVRYSDGVNTFNYAWTPAYDTDFDLDEDEGDCNPDTAADIIDDSNAVVEEVRFIALWLRPDATAANDLGCDGKSVMSAGDLVELRFWLVTGDSDLDTRTPVDISLIPESGSPVEADFKTPATYGSDTYHTLR